MENKLHLDKLRNEVKNTLFIQATNRKLLIEVQNYMMKKGIPSGTTTKLFSQEIPIETLTDDKLYHLARALYLGLGSSKNLLDVNKYFEEFEIKRYSKQKYNYNNGMIRT